jgi:uncharacterized protein YggE
MAAMSSAGNDSGSGRPRPGRTGITVTGTGSAAAAVDEVTVTLGISIIRPEPGAAFQAAAQTATRVLAILADDGADSRSVRTADLTFGPQLEWRDNREFLAGYQAGQRLIVHLAGLAGLERMLTDVAMSGGEGVRIESVALTASNPESALREARARAFADAQAKATQFAELAGRRLGELVRIDERREVDHEFGLSRRPSAAAGGSQKMPVASGDAVVRAAVEAHWMFAVDAIS